MLVTDGGFRPDGTFVHLPLHDVATLTEAFRRAVLKMSVKRALMDIETAQGMLNWPHSGFHVHDGVWASADDKEFTVRLARYGARNPVALATMRIVTFITETKTIDRILDDLRRTRASRRRQRAPPRRWKSAASSASA